MTVTRTQLMVAAGVMLAVVAVLVLRGSGPCDCQDKEQPDE